MTICLRLARTRAVAILAGIFLLATACSSTTAATPAATKKAASGAPKAKTSTQPPSVPKPAKKAGASVSGNAASAAPVEADPACTAAEEGLAGCVDTFAVFCSDAKVYALDCATAFGAGATCGQLDDGTIDCVVE